MTTGPSTNGERPSVSALLAAERPDSQVDFFRSILNNVPAGIAIVDGEHLRVKWANDAYKVSLGAPIAAFAVGPDMDRMAAIMRAVLRDGKPHSEPEFPYAHPTRGSTYLRWSVMPLASAARAAVDLVVVVVDVTEQVKSRLRVEELAAQAENSLQKLGAVVTSLAEGLIIAEPDGSVISMNPAALRMCGYAAASECANVADGLGAFEFLTIDGQALAKDDTPVRRVLLGETISDVEVRVRPKGATTGGSAEWIASCNGTALRGRSGQIQLVVLSMRNITARREAEAKLADSEERYRKMGDLIPFGFWVASPDGMMTFMNDSFLEMTGTTLDECQGLGWTNLLHPQERERTIERWKECVQNDAFWDHEHRVRGKDGQYSTLLSRGVPIRGDDGSIRSWAGINLDVTDRKRFVTELRAAKDTAEAASRSKDEFLSVISHELRTPLNPILAAVQMLELDTRISPDVRAWVEIIRRNAELEARLIDDMLDLTRIFRGKLQLNMELVNLHSVLENVIDICRPQMAEKDLRLVVELGAVRTRVFGDSGRLQQIFWNLLKNAMKFTEVGGGITVRSVDQGSHVAVSVIDTGIGIEPDALSRVFGAFEREGESVTRLFGGLGLGLSISKALVEMHGGKIAAMSDGRDRGASFTVSLETKMTEAKSGEGRAQNGAQGSAASSSERVVRILLVDDHRDTCTLMKSMLVRRGYEVMTAENVHDALALAEEHEFDLLVSDLGLPDASGLELMKKLRERQPILGIALTGFGRDEDVQQTKDAGFSEHMTKPVNIPKLESAIRRLTSRAG